jgi:hypothetical protein
MTEHPDFSPDPQTISALKDSILNQWQQLPTEHQATMTLILLRRLTEGEYGPWILSAIDLLWKEKSPLFSKTLPLAELSHADLKHTNLTEDEMARLTDDDLNHILQEVSAHTINDTFWEEVAFVARLVLAEKGQD